MYVYYVLRTFCLRLYYMYGCINMRGCVCVYEYTYILWVPKIPPTPVVYVDIHIYIYIFMYMYIYIYNLCVYIHVHMYIYYGLRNSH